MIPGWWNLQEKCNLPGQVRWGDAECRRRGLPANPENLRKALSRALHLIRFPLMTVDEFANVVVQTEILTDK